MKKVLEIQAKKKVKYNKSYPLAYVVKRIRQLCMTRDRLRLLYLYVSLILLVNQEFLFVFYQGLKKSE